MLDSEVKDTIQQGYRQFLNNRGLSPRLGQKQMVAAIANCLSDDDADKRLAVIEAGTGTGKTEKDRSRIYGHHCPARAINQQRYP